MLPRSASFNTLRSHVALCCLILGALLSRSTGLDLANITGPYLGLYSIPGRAVVETGASYFSKEVERLCACRVLCITQLLCEAYWLEPLGSERFQCHLSKGGPFVHRPQSVDGAYYGYKKHDTSEFDIDGMLYKLTAATLTWDDAVKECNATKGYSMGIYKTKKQMEIVLKYDATLAATDCTHVYMTDTTGVERWGDGTLYYAYESSSLFYIYNNSPTDDVYDIAMVLDHGLQDRPRSALCRNVCQSDPFNLMLP